MATQYDPLDECNLERENRHQASNLDLQVECSDDKSKFAGALDEATCDGMNSWTSDASHRKYHLSVKESEYEPNIAENHLIRKPISIKNIPRNPLVDAVAAHDRSSTFNLKPVAPAMPTAMRSPARTSTRDLKVVAIIEKANAIRQ
ncbi:hypothetical protein U9M48_015254, partial [Paspalum notatum var. saurae]